MTVVEVTEVRNVVTVSPVTNEITVQQVNNVVEVEQGGGIFNGVVHTIGGTDHDLSGALTLGGLFTASGHIQMPVNGELRDSGGVAAVKVRASGTAAAPHVEFYDGAAADVFMRLENHVGVGVDPLANTVLRIGMPTVGTGIVTQLGLAGSKTFVAGQSINYVGFTSSAQLAGVAATRAVAFNVQATVADSVGGGTLTEFNGFRMIHSVTGGTVDYLAYLAFPHPAVTTGVITDIVAMDIGDMDEGVSGNAYGIRMGDRAGKDASKFGNAAAVFMFARPLSIESTTDEINPTTRNFYSVHAPNITIGKNAKPTLGALVDFDSTVGAVLFPRMTTAQRDALPGVADGMGLYNLTTARMEKRQAGAWVAW